MRREEALAHWEAVAPKTNCVLLISPIFSVKKKERKKLV
jgi:hypothetical protein